MNLLITILTGTRVFIGILLGYERRLDEYTKAHNELIQFINDNTILVDNNKRPAYVREADRSEIMAKYMYLKTLRAKVESKLKIAK
jgi:hypothetical protein